MKYRPKLDPKVDLKGATPESLARALLRGKNRPSSRHVGKPVGADKVAVEEPPSDHAGDGTTHLE